MNFDLTEAVEAAARVMWDHDFGGDPQWEAGDPLHKHYYREALAPAINAAYPAIWASVIAKLRADLASEDEARNLRVAAELGLHSWRLEEAGRG